MSGRNGPILATVIPIFNESKYIEKCLDSLINQNLNASEHMVLVLDGNSTDDSVEIVKKMIESSKSSNGPEILLLNNPGKFVAEARNLALAELPSSVEFMIELIGHCTVPSDHLSKRLEAWSEVCDNSGSNVAGLGVRVLASDGTKTMVESWIEATLDSGFGSGSGQFDNFSSTAETKVPAFCMHSRKAVEEIGGWDTNFITSQDSDLSMRLLDSGFKLYRTNQTHVKMVKRTNYSSWIKMGYRYGFWRTKIIRKHPSRHSKREFLPWMGLILTAALLLFTSPYWYIPISMYGLVIAIEGIRSSLRWRSISLIFGVPLCLFTLHTTFSIGLVSGIFRKGKASNDR